MKIDRKQLRQAVTDALAAHRAQHDRDVVQWEAALEQHRADWVKMHGEQWAEAARTIARKVRAGEVVTDSDLPRARHGIRATYDTPHSLDELRRPRQRYSVPYELAALGSALDAITDDEISHTGLRALGITSATLRDAIAYLGRGTTEERPTGE